jgi:hypothetical protein
MRVLRQLSRISTHPGQNGILVTAPSARSPHSIRNYLLRIRTRHGDSMGDWVIGAILGGMHRRKSAVLGRAAQASRKT